MCAREPDRGHGLSALVPAAMRSPAAQGVNALAGAAGADFVVAGAVPGAGSAALVATALIAQAAVVAVVSAVPAAWFARVWVRVASLLLAGAVRAGVILVAVSWLGGAPTPADVLAQIGLSVFYTSLWLGAAGLVVQGTRDYRAMFAAQFDLAVRRGVQESREMATGDWAEATALARREHAVARERIEFLAARFDGSPDADIARDVVIIAHEIHLAALERVRPASHVMWSRARREAPVLRARSVIDRAFRFWPAPWAATLCSVTLVAGVSATIGGGVVTGVFTALAVAAVTTLCLALRADLQRRQAWAGVPAALALIAVAPLVFAVLEVAGSGLGLPPATSGAALVSAATLALCFTCIALQGIRRHRAALLAEMDHLLATGFWQAEVGEAIAGQHSADAATYLHHQVQSQLLAVALQLELAAQAGSGDRMAGALDRVRAQLAKAPLARAAQGGHATLEQIPGEWQGICRVELDLPEPSRAPEATWASLDLLVREAVANAVRGGGATMVRVDVLVRADTLEVEVRDNGTPGSRGEAGLGSLALSRLGAIPLPSPEPFGGTCFRVSLPLRD